MMKTAKSLACVKTYGNTSNPGRKTVWEYRHTNIYQESTLLTTNAKLRFSTNNM
jgi:hypothetical protein